MMQREGLVFLRQGLNLRVFFLRLVELHPQYIQALVVAPEVPLLVADQQGLLEDLALTKCQPNWKGA